jgi:hypothetical protein
VFAAFGIQHAMRLRHIAIRSLSGSTIYFHVISHTAEFRKLVIEHKMCVLIFSKPLSETFLILRRTEPGMISKTFV